MHLFRLGAVTLFFLVLLPAVWGVSYDVLVQESGNAVVIASIEGPGLYTLNLPADAVPEVKGALYLQDGNILTLSIGSTGKASVIYQTKEFVSSYKGKYLLKISLDGPVELTLPKSFELISVYPNLYIQETDVRAISFDNRIQIVYSAGVVPKSSYIAVYSFFAAFAAFIGFVVLRMKNKNQNK